MALHADNPTTWQATFPEYFHWAEWEQEDSAVLFHQGSGETLQLSPLGAFVLRSICRERLTLESLADLTARHFDLQPDKEMLDAIRTSLHTFRRKGLVYSVTA